MINMVEEKQVCFKGKYASIEGTVYLMPPDSEKGYNFGYAVFVPKNCEKDTTLIMHSCNTGNNVPVHLEEASEIARRSTYEKPNPGMWIGNDLNMPVIVPLIPRIQGFYTQALGSKVFNSDISTLIADQDRRSEDEKLSEEELKEIQEECRDIPGQVANMIKSAQTFLSSIGITVDDKVIAEGYSAGSKFANCFTALHPEMVKACICGGNSGLGILPLTEYKGKELKYPLGVADIPDFDSEAFCSIPQLYYMGTEDSNDPAVPKCKFKVDENGEYALDQYGGRIPLLDANGEIIPVVDASGKLMPRYRENYTQEEIELIHTLLGKNIQTRFKTNETVYNELGVNATFLRLPGDHITVNQNNDGKHVKTIELMKDFIKNVLEQEKELQDEPNISL